MRLTEQDFAFARSAGIDPGSIKTAPDVTAAWGTGDWEMYAQQLEDDARAKVFSQIRRRTIAGILAVAILIFAATAAQYFAP